MRSKKRLSIVAGSAAAVVLAAVVLPAAFAEAATTPAAGVQFKLGHSNKCLNVAGNSTANSAKIAQYTCSDTALNDKFKLVPKAKDADGYDQYWVQSVSSGKCLNVAGNSTANSAKIIQYTCAVTPNTLWWADTVPGKPTIRLVSTRSGKCLNLPGASTANSVQLIQYTCTSTTTAKNEQFYLPPATSANANKQAFTVKQAPAVVQGSAPAGGGVAPVYFSYISANNQFNQLTDFDPDPNSTNPNPPQSSWYQTDPQYFPGGFTGTATTAKLADGRVQTEAHDASTGDVFYSDEDLGQKGTGAFNWIWNIGGGTSAQPVVGPYATNGALATYAVINGALWFAPQVLNNTSVPLAAWRSLGGTGLTGTPVSVKTSTGARIFALNTSGHLLTATLAGTTLSTWTDLGGDKLTGKPSVVAGQNGLLSVFVSNGNARVVTKKQNADGTFPTAWTQIGDLKGGAPSAVVDPSNGRIAVALRLMDGLVFLAYETAQGSGEFADWVQISDPDNYPNSVAQGDPTLYPYTVPSGSSFGLAFMSAGSDDFPYVLTFGPTAQLAKGAHPKADFRQPTHPTKKTLISGKSK